MKANLLTFFLLLFLLPLGNAQIINGQDTLYGNEWINFDQSYFKLLVAEDGIYRIPQQTLSAANLPLGQVNGSQFQLFHNGEEVPIYVSTDGNLGSNDFIEFFGKKNTSELDRHLFKDPDAEMMNPLYSLFTDSSAYFLTWKASGSNLRYEQVGNDLTNLPQKEDFCWFTIGQVFSNAHDKKRNSEGVRNSYFDIAEGFASGYAVTQNINSTPIQPFVGNQDAKLEIRFGCGLGDHSQAIKINGTQVWQEDFYDFAVKQQTLDIPNTSLTSQIQISIQGNANSNDKSRIAYTILRYPRRFDFSGAPIVTFELDETTAHQYLEISNFLIAGGTAPVLYDLTNHIRIETTLEGNMIKVSLPPSVMARKLVLVNPVSGVKAINTLQPVQFINYFETKGDYLILSNAKLFDDGTGVNWVQEYANYRASQVGGNYMPVVVEIQQVYDQFGWGLNRHSLALRNFAHFIRSNWDDPKFMFLIGKGREFTETRTSVNLNNAANLPLMVASYGSPAADNLISATHDVLTPTLPIGRLAAVTPEEIKYYLNKIKDAEANVNTPQTIQDKSWMKKLLHLGGGDPVIQTSIKSYLAQMEEEIENNEFGGDVYSFFKTSTDPIQISRSEEILNLINSGVSIITFFGHSGANTFDFSLDSPDNFDNKGKYPLFFSLGCFSGQIHGTIPGVSERFVFEEDKGAIAFMASTSYGYVSALQQLCKEYYHQLGTQEYGQGIGKVLQKAIEAVENQGFGSAKELIQQFTLHGDPAYVLNAFPGPDYTINPSGVQLEPAKVNIELDSFVFSFDIQNIGKNLPDSMVLEIRRDLPSGVNLLMLRDTIETPAYNARLSYKLPTMGTEALGLNRFYVKIDADNTIVELPAPMAEMNNELNDFNGSLGISSFFFANDIRPVYPKDYAIVGKSPVVLKASTANTFADSRQYILQLDTTELFNSPHLKQHTGTMPGGVLKWQPDITLIDSTVYYWRVSPDSIDISGYTWRKSSFLYLQGAPGGWNQSHYFQYGDDVFSNLELSNNREWKFLDDFKDIRITQGTYPTIRPEISVNNEPHRYIPWDGPIQGGVMIMVLDSITVNPWHNIPTGPGANVGMFGSNIPSWTNGTYAAFPYTTRSVQGRKLAMNFIDSIIPTKNYVVIITVQETNFDYKPQDWSADSLANGGKNLFNLLEAQGAKLIRQSEAAGAKPYYFIYKKDDPSFIPYEGYTDPSEITQNNFGLLGNWDNGYVQSRIIGPARSWESLHWKISHLEAVNDSILLEVTGIRLDSTEEILLERLTVFDTSLANIDASVFPFLKLRFFATDTTNFDPPQLDFWRVNFEGLHEVALNPACYFSLNSDTLQQGEMLDLKIAVENLGDYDFDSLQMKYSIISVNNQSLIVETIEPALFAGDTLIAHFNQSTDKIGGTYQIVMEANPANNPSEIFRFNNVAVKELYVKQDQRNPLLDVFFDGAHIMDGDLVSAEPLIRIELLDENSYLPLNDTSLINVFFQYPEETELRRVSFDNGNVTFSPANMQEGKNKASIEIRQTFEKDGAYQLIIQAEDATGNQSGLYDYKTAFEVITASSISNIVNYPNPFSTATRFLYTMTGSIPPAQYKLQIMTVSGRIVREINQDEMGSLKPGTHLTDFAWDGRDTFGDKLANGVYVYRFVAKDEDGNDWEKYDTGTDGYFKSGFGKMVIVH